MTTRDELLAAVAAARRAIEQVKAHIRAEGVSEAVIDVWPPADLSVDPDPWLRPHQAAGLRRCHHDTVYDLLRNPRGQPIGFKLEEGGRWCVDRRGLLIPRQD